MKTSVRFSFCSFFQFALHEMSSRGISHASWGNKCNVIKKTNLCKNEKFPSSRQERESVPSDLPPGNQKKRKLLIKLMQRHFFIRCHHAHCLTVSQGWFDDFASSLDLFVIFLAVPTGKLVSPLPHTLFRLVCYFMTGSTATWQL